MAAIHLILDTKNIVRMTNSDGHMPKGMYYATLHVNDLEFDGAAEIEKVAADLAKLLLQTIG